MDEMRTLRKLEKIARPKNLRTVFSDLLGSASFGKGDYRANFSSLCVGPRDGEVPL